MPKTRSDKLRNAIAVLESLPKDAQGEIVHELEERLAAYTTPHMNAAQRAEVKRRLALPMRYVPHKTIKRILRRYISAR